MLINVAKMHRRSNLFQNLLTQALLSGRLKACIKLLYIFESADAFLYFI